MSIKNRLLLFNRPVIRRFFIRSALSYLLVALLGASFVFPMIGYVRGMLLQERMRAEEDDTASSLLSLSQQLSTLSNTFLYLSEQKGFDRVSLIRGAADARDYVYLTYARDYLDAIRNANSLIEDVIVSYFDNDVVITANYAFDTHACFANFYPSEEIEARMKTYYKGFTAAWGCQISPEFSLHLPMHASEQPVIPLCMPLCSPNVRPIHVQGSVLVLLRREQVINALFSSAVRAEGLYALFSPDGQWICGNTREAIGGIADYSALEVPGEYFVAVAGVPSATISQHARPVLLLFARYMAAGIAVSLLAAFFSAARATQPVQKVLEEIGGFDALSKNQTAHQFILQSIDKMLENIDQLQSISNAAEKAGLTRRVERLLAGCGSPSDAAPPIPVQGVLCYVQYQPLDEGREENNALSALLPDYVQERLPKEDLLHVLTSESFLILIPWESEAERTQKAGFLRTLLEEVSSLFSVSISGVLGTAYHNPEEIAASFEAIKLLHYTLREKTEETVWLMEDAPAGGHTLTIANQTELFHLLTAGKGDAACDRMEKFFLAYREMGMEQVYYALRLVLLLATEQQNIPLFVRPYRTSATPDENIQEILSSAHYLCDQISQGRRSHNELLKERILNTIEMRFTDSELYNASLAELCGISEKYLCSFVKEQTGRTVTDLIQSKRIERAYELLTRSDKSVSDIWRLAGFSSYNTFYKIMKRAYGMSPLELRAEKA